MAPWVMPLYIFSGIIMAIGAYLTIRYRPYCTLKSPEREIAMELHRKKLMNEPMNREEIEANNLYKFKTIMYMRGNLILFIGVAVHIFIFAGNSWYSLTPLYYMSMISLLPVFIRNSSHDPYCTRNSSVLHSINSQKEHYLIYIHIFQKKEKGEILNDDQTQLYKDEHGYHIFHIVYRNILNFGVVLHLILDVWFGLNGRLIIN